MKKKLILSIAALVLTFFVGISVAKAWYVNMYKVGTIDASTKDLSFIYTIDDSEDINVNKYSISNLAFFDIDNENETAYFMDMVTHITITIGNTSKEQISYKLSFTNEIYSEKDDEENEVSKAYVECIISKEELSIGEVTTISNLIGDATVSGELIGDDEETDEIDGTTQIHLYLFGVQEIDSSNNTFLTKSYNFDITITAE